MPNRLADETSPYLQQHAENPVDWFPWGEAALRLAAEHDKPILLSVGYSACHWCHVMAHESFEDPQVAALMNELYINIKVDREERPDLDQIYQNAHAMLTQRSGGWPLTMFLMPDQTPFFGGTYFPKTARQGMPGFVDLLPRVAEAFRTQRAKLEKQNESLREALAHALPPAAQDAALSPAPLDMGLRELKRIFDETSGGIGSAPKFPHPVELEFCLRRAQATQDDYALRMVTLTLTKMAEGGIFDQLGGGFCRYSVDQNWTIPHFEKMLYDNGPLLRLYSDAWLIGRQPLFERTARATVGWVMREMQSPAGGYYSSIDADSEHEEGKFYVWTPDEIRAALSPDEYAVVEPHYGLDAAANFEHRHWNLRVMKPLAFLAKRLALDLSQVEARLGSACSKLLALREERVRPGRDEKILTSWNALMIKGMARASRVFGEPAWLASARAATEFIRSELWRTEDRNGASRGRLLATCKDGKAHLNAYLDDYAFLLDALLELAQCEFRAADLEWAGELGDVLLEQFEDRDNGGFYFVSNDHEKLIVRAKIGHDNATASGNGIAAFALNRLGHLLGDTRYLEAAERTLKAFKARLDTQASAHTSLCSALEEVLRPPTLVILRGAGDELGDWQQQLNANYLPQTLVLALPLGIADLPPALDKPAMGAVNAWICHGVRCLPPNSDLSSVKAILRSRA